ncbi:VOC family protein [Terriglobus sp. RCC_193]|uniref:VOC family protein n=1 Tax=Terriglobus sp. RCC_193 TaxID=3239218 RepID=UPI00352594CA
MSTATHSYVAAATVGIQPPSYRLPDEIHVGRVTLAVSDLERSLSFYQDVIGLAPINAGSEVAELGVDGKVLLELRQLPGILPLVPRSRLGLYHAAFLLPDRGALGSFVNHLHSMKIRYGSSDHFFSEALYLVDPDGLNIEVYADRPRNTWRVEGNELIGGGVQLDLAGLSAASSGPWSGAPTGTTVGHVHLYIGDLREAARFYHEVLGFTIMTWSLQSALFIAAGGYHHYVGLNVWAAGSPIASAQDARLLHWELVLNVPIRV